MKLLTQWAFTSSALILIVLAVRVLFRNRLSARLRYALWGVVLLRLLVPFQVELPAAANEALPLLASNLAQDVTPRLDDTMLYAIPTKRYLVDRVQPGDEPEYSRTLHSEADREYYSGGVVYDKNGITRYFFMMPASELLMIIWKTGAGLCLLVILYSNWGFSLRLGRRRRRLEDVDAPVPVYTAEGLPSPCLFGVFRPAVYVTPVAAENPDTLRHVLAHELTHYKHGDHLWSLLRCFSLALHWYNPLVWLAVVLSKQDGELACDEGAVARLGEAERIPYGRTLVDMVAARALRPGDLLSCSTAMTGGESSIKRRVTQIVKKPKTVKIALFAVIALVALGLVFTFAGRSGEEPGELPGNTPSGPEGQDQQQGGGEDKAITPVSSPELEEFFAQLESAQSIYVGQPMLSSANPPGLISDPEALAQAKELLGKARAPLQLPEGVTREEFWESIRPFLSATEYQDMEEPPTLTQEDLKDMLFTRGNPIVLCPGPEVTLDAEYRYWLADHMLLLFDEELEENPKALATFSDDVYSQLAELARNQENLAAVIGGMSFSDLPPGEEQVSEQAFFIPPVSEQAFFIPEDISSISYSLTYVRPILTLEFGLRSADGKKYSYSQEANGGVANGTFEDIPAGSYQIFVRNMGDLNDYTPFQPYQPESVSDDATGAVNFQITK